MHAWIDITALLVIALLALGPARRYVNGLREGVRAADGLRRRADAAVREQLGLATELARVRRAEADLRDSEVFSRALFGAAYAGLVVVDLGTGQVMDANPAAAALLGVPVEDLVGTLVRDRLGPPAELVAAAGDPSGPGDTVTVTDGAGGRRVCIRKVTPLDDGEGDLAVVSLLDITAQKQVEAELRESWARLNEANVQLKRHKNQIVQSEKLASIGQLAAGVAHEINNPVGYVSSNLGSIREYAGIMRTLLEMHERLAAAPDDAELRARIEAYRAEQDLDFVLADLDDLLAESQAGVARVTEIVQNLKSFARNDGVERKDTDLNDVVESMIRMVWNELKYRCTVERDFGDVPPIPCNAGRIGQVIMNMLVNAAHAIPETGGTVAVATATEGDHAVVTIRDDGCGMDAGTAARIFDPFFTTKAVGAGTGLGLSVSHGIVEEHGGRIEVASAPGRGTTFRILLPLQPAPAPAAGMIG